MAGKKQDEPVVDPDKQDEPVVDPDKRDDPTRCGGYVLTNEGWKLADLPVAEPDED